MTDREAPRREVRYDGGLARRLARRARMMELGATPDDAAVLAAIGIEPGEIAKLQPKRLARLLAERADRDLPVRLPDDYEPELDRLETVVDRARERR